MYLLAFGFTNCELLSCYSSNASQKASKGDGANHISQVREKLARKMKERFDIITVPR